MSATGSFERSFGAIEAIFAFTSGFFSQNGLDRRMLPAVDLVVEEVFTNMVKYGHPADPAARVRIEMAAVDGGVEVSLTDSGVEPFDVTRVPDADTSLPAEQRQPGGLGLHLARRLVDSWRYEYEADRRESRITFRKTPAHAPATGSTSSKGGM